MSARLQTNYTAKQNPPVELTKEEHDVKYIICYDIQENKIRSRVAKLLESRAYRLQYSVFLGTFEENEARDLQRRLIELTCKAEEPLILMTPLCNSCAGKLWKIGRALEEPSGCIVA